PAGLARGGGIISSEGSLTISGSTVKDNLAEGGPGGPPPPSDAGIGGGGGGGGIFSSFQTFVLSNSALIGSEAIGGNGTKSAGGNGSGGGLVMVLDSPFFGGSATISGTTFVNNLAQGGAGSGVLFGSIGAPGGNALAGGVSADVFTSLQMTDSTFTGNEA